MRDESCAGCGFRLSTGMYVFRVQSRAYCLGCVRGPYPVADTPVSRLVPSPRNGQDVSRSVASPST